MFPTRISSSAAAAALLLATPAAGQTRYAETPATSMAGFGASLLVVGQDIAVGRSPGGAGGITGGAAWEPRGGGVHLFRKAGEGWTEYALLAPTGNKSTDLFGAAMAADGEFLAVGAPGRADGGAVFLYRRAGGNWTESAVIANPGGAKGASFGGHLAFRNGVLIIGAASADSARGAAYLVRRTGQTWSSPVRVGGGANPQDRFGQALLLDGERLFVGASGVLALGGQNPNLKPGTVFVYRASGSGWTEETQLSAPPADSVKGFGGSLFAAGGEILAGSPIAHRGAGVLYRFARGSDGKLTIAGKLEVSPPSPTGQTTGGPPPTFMGFGMAAGSSGDQLLISAPFSGGFVGAVHTFAKDGAGWTAGQRIVPEATGQAGFGFALAASADLVAIAAPQADFGEGLAYVYRRRGADWALDGKLMDKPFELPAITGKEQKCNADSVAAFGCKDVDLLAYLPISAVGGARGVKLNDIWGWTDPETQHEWALVGRVDGTSFVDVTDPSNPKFVADLPLTKGARPNAWRDIKVYRNHAFIVADGAGQHGMQVFDLTRLRKVTRFPTTLEPDTTYDKIASAHNIVINEETGFAYTVGNGAGGETCGGALHMIDIRNPKVPTFAGCYADKATGIQKTGYTHDAQCVTYRGPDSRYTGKEICFNSSETAVGIADVTDKANPKPLAVAEYPNTAYSHQGWLTDDHKYFYLDDEGDEVSGLVPKTRTLVWDVSKLDEPVLVKEFLGTTGASDHNLYVRGRYMYQADYVAGLRVIDIGDPTNPREVGYFDTVPWGGDTAGFEGAWSNYPYFKSGTIVVSSIGQGLFVLKYRNTNPVP